MLPLLARMEMVHHSVSVLVIRKEEEREWRTCPSSHRHSHRSCAHFHHGLELGYVAILRCKEAGNVVFGRIAMCPAKNLPHVEKAQLDTWDNKLSFHRPRLTSPLNNEENLPRHHLLPPSDSPPCFIGQGSSWASSLSARKPGWDAGSSRKKEEQE